MDEMQLFREINAQSFFKNQIIRGRKDIEKQNNKFTKEFNEAFAALVEGRFTESKASSKRFRYFTRKWLLYLLYIEFVYYCKEVQKPLPSKEELAQGFGIPLKDFNKFAELATNTLPKNKYAARSYRAFVDFCTDAELYATHTIKNIAVCATMSAGKSTFVNALLGRDVLPARNEATTAKITSVYDKDGSKAVIGFVQKKDGAIEDISNDISLKEIDAWNGSGDVKRVFLQGDLDGIGNNGIIASVHDTPGTNNSGDVSHHEVTMQFLQENKMDALIFVSNATQLCTNDEKTLLLELYDAVVKPLDIPVVFILNKADAIDDEKESLEDIINGYRAYLGEIGFSDAHIFPLSARGARLLKMAKNGYAKNFTPREAREFDAVYTSFTELYNFAQKESSPCEQADESITVLKTEYKITSLMAALERTGLVQIENFIESILTRSKND